MPNVSELPSSISNIVIPKPQEGYSSDRDRDRDKSVSRGVGIEGNFFPPEERKKAERLQKKLKEKHCQNVNYFLKVEHFCNLRGGSKYVMSI